MQKTLTIWAAHEDYVESVNAINERVMNVGTSEGQVEPNTPISVQYCGFITMGNTGYHVQQAVVTLNIAE